MMKKKNEEKSPSVLFLFIMKWADQITLGEQVAS
jgi:hypothetical protein